jgi:hypothetical protein
MDNPIGVEIFLIPIKIRFLIYFPLLICFHVGISEETSSRVICELSSIVLKWSKICCIVSMYSLYLYYANIYLFSTHKSNIITGFVVLIFLDFRSPGQNAMWAIVITWRPASVHPINHIMLYQVHLATSLYLTPLVVITTDVVGSNSARARCTRYNIMWQRFQYPCMIMKNT